jgi:uncharacterized protein YbjQ (UPF0145 family)
MTNILITTTPTVENRPIREYLGIVSGEAVMGRWWLSNSVLEYATEKLDNFDWHSYELSLKRKPSAPVDYILATKKSSEAEAASDWAGFKVALHEARDWAIHQMAKAAEELGANAVIGVRIDYKTIDIIDGREERAMILIATGTAVRL